MLGRLRIRRIYFPPLLLARNEYILHCEIRARPEIMVFLHAQLGSASVLVLELHNHLIDCPIAVVISVSLAFPTWLSDGSRV
jgi:hypothetical protein